MAREVEIATFSEGSPDFAGSLDPAEVFSEAMTVPVSDLVKAARSSREEAIRYRETGNFKLARSTVDTAVTVLGNRISLIGIESSPTSYENLTSELLGTLLVQADLAATDGDFQEAKGAIDAANRINRRLAPEQRINLAVPARAAYEQIAQNGSLADKIRAKSALRKLPKKPKTIEQHLKQVDWNIEVAKSEASFLDDTFRIAQEWLAHGDLASVEAARLLAVYRMTPDPRGEEDLWSLKLEERQLNILMLCAKRGNEEAARDAIHVVKTAIEQNPDYWHNSNLVGQALLAGLFVRDQEVVDGAIAVAERLRQYHENEKDFALGCIERAIPTIKAGEWDPEKIPGLHQEHDGMNLSSWILYRILENKPMISQPKWPGLGPN